MNTRALVQMQLVKLFRQNRDWTQAEAAEWYGCSERSWRRYETGERNVPQPLLNRIGNWRPK